MWRHITINGPDTGSNSGGRQAMKKNWPLKFLSLNFLLQIISSLDFATNFNNFAVSIYLEQECYSEHRPGFNFIRALMLTFFIGVKMPKMLLAF